MKKLDVLELGLVWNRLVSIADEMTSILIRTAFSTVVNESHDCACILLDRHGNSIAQSSHALPAFMGTMPYTAKDILRIYGADGMHEGDVIATNDPWVAGGHLPDLTVIRPVFHRGALVAMAASTAHLPDIGGKVWSADCAEVFEEGFRIPPIKIVERGVRNELFFNILRSNVRYPDDVEHDILAQVAATRFGAERLVTLLERRPDIDISALAVDILDRSDEGMRKAIAGLPRGTYVHEVSLDGFDEELTLRCRLTVDGERLHVDFAGSSLQQPWGINSVIHYTRAYASYALKCALNPEAPCNEGSFRRIDVAAPKGSVLNAQMPAAVGGRHLTGMFVPFAIYGALAKARPELAMADSGLPGSPYFTLKWPDTGRAVSQFFSSNGGMGATWGGDGVSVCSFPTNISNVPIEVVEARSGLVVEKRELTTDSGGPGRWRGGLGQTYVLRVPESFDGQAWVAMLSDRTGHPALGRLGGQTGSLRTNRLNGLTDMHSKRRIQIKAGDRIEVQMPGGGGVGDPRERSRKDIERDLLEGYISAAQARASYGYEDA
ncbi:MAG: hydantoinase B/oxoprolinase family protein [Burkholderiales bacterium]